MAIRNWRRWMAAAEEPVSIAPLVTFRIVIGALLAFSTVRFMYLGWIEDHYAAPVFHFKYPGFAWIEPLSLPGLYLVHVLLILCSLLVMLGLYYRLAAIGQFLLFTYTELIDLTYYLNHYYFVSIACALLVLAPANRAFSIDAWRNPFRRGGTVPRWSILMFQVQLGIVYCYAGLWKINADWLIAALPLRIWVPANDALPLIGPLFTWYWMPWVFSWVGMVYDVSIAFWLSWSRTRPWAYLTVVIFHTLTALMFQIGVFPLVMIGATLIFFSATWHQNLQAYITRTLRIKPVPHNLTQARPFKRTSRWIFAFLMLHFAFQIIFPWRYLLYPGNVFWTEEGYRFSWRVMLMEKAGTATFYIRDSAGGREGEVVNRDFLNPHQEKQMAMQPDMILQYAHFLRDHYAKKGMQNPTVRAEVYVTLNARPSRLLIDPGINLANIRDGWSHKTWILPFE